MSEVPQQGEVTRLLQEWSGGRPEALDQLMPLVYRALRSLADRALRGERGDHTLQPTDLVHEAYLRLVDQNRTSWQDRTHFMAVAATMMRRILVDHARRQHAARRVGHHEKVSMNTIAEPAAGDRAIDVVELDQVLNQLAELDPRQARVVELRFFGGLTIKETAAVLEISTATVTREWMMARAWLLSRLAVGTDGP